MAGESAILWAAAPTAVVLHDSTGTGTLANDTMSAASAEFDNSSALATHGYLELVGTWGTQPSDGNPTVNVYRTLAPDGTNYGSDPVTGGVDCIHQLVAIIPVRKVTAAQRKSIKLEGLLPPHKQKYWIDNQTGQTLGANWGLKLFHDSLEAQAPAA